MKTKIIIILSTMIFCSCVQTQVRETPELPFKSFVRIDVLRHKANCFTCVLESGVGSGSIIDSNKVLTAGHVCAGIRTMVNNADQSEVLDKVIVTLQDDSGTIYGATEINIHASSDLCLITTDRTMLPPSIPLAAENPKRGKRVWSLMAPDGMSGKGLTPVVSGHYAGSDSLLSLFTIPASPGASGGPILNANGEIVGLVSQINKTFHHLVVSPSIAITRDFVLSSE